eukprot:EG_transcript_692
MSGSPTRGSSASPAATGKRPSISPGRQPGRDSCGGGHGDDAPSRQQQAALLHEMQRQRELQDRIERRDRRRECARHQADDQRRRETQALRAAMWLTVCAAVRRDLAARLAEQRTRHTLVACLVPQWRRLLHRQRLRQARERFLQGPGADFPRLTPDALRATGPLFAEWPEADLASFIAEQQLSHFPSGTYICHQEDPSGLLYVLVAGAVDVVLRRPDSTAKARGKRTGLTVAQLTPGRYVGEYGVFAGEPRAATLYCASPVGAWAASKDCLCKHLQRVPRPVYRAICTAFEASMARIYRVRPAQLASTALFRRWDVATLEQVVAKLQPVFFQEDAVILEAGSPGTAIYILAKGRCRLAAGAAAEERTAGAMLGLRGCVFLEPHRHEVRALTTVQAWRLPKAALMDFLLQRPDRFLEAKQRLNADLARMLAKPPLEDLVGGSPFHGLPRSTQLQLYAALQPFVVAPQDPVVRQGEPVDALLFLTAGQCTEGAAPGPAGAVRCLGAEPLRHRTPRWPRTVTALDRVEGWQLPLADVVAGLERQLDTPPPAARALLADLALLRQG